MYDHLVEIGLKNYLDSYFFNQTWIVEDYLQKLDLYVSTLPVEQQKILRLKYSSNRDHLQQNDLLHELLVASVFHPNGSFIHETTSEKSADILDGSIRIEIKTINASPTEVERVKIMDPGTVRTMVPRDDYYEDRIRRKFRLRIDKAVEQLSGSGLVYLVWDSDLTGNWSDRKERIEKLFTELVAAEENLHPNLIIKSIYFGDLRERLN